MKALTRNRPMPCGAIAKLHSLVRSNSAACLSFMTERASAIVLQRAKSLLDSWHTVIEQAKKDAAQRAYSPYDPDGKGFKPLLRTVLDPTVNIFEGFFESKAGEMHPGYVSVARRLPIEVRRSLTLGGLTVPKGEEASYADAFASMLRFLAALHQAGVAIIPGSIRTTSTQ